MKKTARPHVGLYVLLAFISLDLIFLSWWVFFGGGSRMDGRLGLLERRVDSVVMREDYQSDLGDEVMVNKAAAEAVKSLKPELAALGQKQDIEEQVLGMSDEEDVREYFIPIGSGSTTKREWADMSSAQVTVNSARYGEIVAVYFEASLRSDNGTAEARLLDKTSSQVIHESNVSHGGGEYGWTLSKPFSLSEGGKRYMVQLKSTTGEKVEMSQARLRILARE